jgi:hypothetical protein
MTKLPRSLLWAYLQMYQSDSKKEAFVGELLLWRFQRYRCRWCEVLWSFYPTLEWVERSDLIVVLVLHAIVLSVGTSASSS